MKALLSLNHEGCRPSLLKPCSVKTLTVNIKRLAHSLFSFPRERERERRLKKKKRLPRFPCQKKSLINQSSHMKTLLVIVAPWFIKRLDLGQSPPPPPPHTHHLPITLPLNLTPLPSVLPSLAFFMYLNKGPPPTSLPFVSHLVFCFC